MAVTEYIMNITRKGKYVDIFYKGTFKMNTSEQRLTVKRDFLFIVPEFAL